MSTSRREKTIIRLIGIFLGIVWIILNSDSVNSYAKTSFSGTKPVGVMATAVGTDIAVSWEPVAGAAGYLVYESEGEAYHLVKQIKKCRYILTEKEGGKVYHYYIKAYKVNKRGKKIYSKKSKKVSTTVAEEGVSTIKNFLQTAIAPVGSTMYIWGGGWNRADTGAGTDAKRIGLSPMWRSFAGNKKSSYDYNDYRYKIHKGLDCSGYVGWCVYNILNTDKNQKGYVYSASEQAKKFSQLGFGDYQLSENVKNYCAGDVMSSTCECCGHVWIAIGQCKDGSVVLVHSSPAGVQLSGTVTSSGKKESKAYKLAKKYMKKYYSSWYKKYPNVSRGSTYLSHYAQMRWTITGNNVVLSDPDGYQNMSAGEVLADLFGE